MGSISAVIFGAYTAAALQPDCLQVVLVESTSMGYSHTDKSVHHF